MTIRIDSVGGLTAAALLTPTETAVLWGLHHPYWLVAIAVAIVILLQLSLTMVGQLLRRLLQWLSRSPFFLGRWLMAKTTPGDPHPQQQIVTILQRLNKLQKEQETLLAELKEQLPRE